MAMVCDPERPLPLRTSVKDGNFYHCMKTRPEHYRVEIPFSKESVTFIPHEIQAVDFLACMNMCKYKPEYEHMMGLFYNEIMDMVHTEPGSDTHYFPSEFFIDTTQRYIVAISPHTKETSAELFVFDNLNLCISVCYDDSVVYITSSSIEIVKKNAHVRVLLHETNEGVCLKGTVKSNSVTLHSTYMDSKHSIQQHHIYTNQTTHHTYKSYHALYPNQDEIFLCNKNGLLIQSLYKSETNIKKTISQCMMTDSSTGVRFRGSYEEASKGGKIVSKLLKKDDTIIYNEDDEEVKVDVVRKKRVDDIIIGWKVAKSSSGELRIVKLAIPLDAETVMSIDPEFFSTRGKERCSKALVMDIQLCVQEEEISVVPDEKVAYSYLYQRQAPLAYTIGSEITPDMFDPNPNESCSQGIHFYQNRNDVFDVYVNGTM